MRILKAVKKHIGSSPHQNFAVASFLLFLDNKNRTFVYRQMFSVCRKTVIKGKPRRAFWQIDERKRRKKQRNRRDGYLSTFFLQIFEIHGSKFKPYQIRDLGEATVGGITHSVFFFRIRKDTFNRLFTLPVKIGILRSVSFVIGKLLVILPNMPLSDLHRILGMCAKMSCRAILTYFGIALVFSVSVSIGRAVCKRMVGTRDK